MGVRGLTTYINYKQNVFLHIHYLHDTPLVIDGNSLCAQLYRSLNCFSAFGGDYDKYALYVKQFFKTLKRCNIISYVVFDGSYETRKLRTAYSRLRSKIHGAARLDPVTQGSRQIFPLLLRDVFKEVLTEIDVAYTTCEFEADDEIAALARHLDCPVLSYDSDFFIYNVLYIPFNTIDIKSKPIEKNGSKVNAIECKLYKVDYLIQHFGGLKQELLPLLATLLGNDYVEKKVFRKFFSQLKLPKSKKKQNDQQRCIHGLFNFLQNETLDSAISKILGRLKKKQKDRVFYIIKKSVEGYHRTDCKSLKYFGLSDSQITEPIDLKMPDEEISVSDADINDENILDGDEGSDDDSKSNESSSDVNETEDNDDICDWFVEGIRNKTILPAYFNLYTHHLYFCCPQAEDYTDSDSFLCALPIMRYAFDILTDFSQETFIYVSREQDCNYHRMMIGKEYAIPRLIERPFNELSSEELRMLFHHFITQKLENLDLSDVDLLPSSFRLLTIAILYWIANCNVPLANVHSLIISYITLTVIDEKTGTFRGHNFFNNKYSKILQSMKNRSSSIAEEELLLNKNKVQYEDCLLAASVLLKHFEMDDSIKKKPRSYDVKRTHSFAQFQCCLQQINSLNTLCGELYESTIYSKCYNGTLIYNIALKLENQINPSAFIEQYLKGATTVLTFYRSIWKLLNKMIQEMKLTTIQSLNKKKRSRRKKNVDDNEISFIMKGFESEVVI